MRRGAIHALTLAFICLTSTLAAFAQVGGVVVPVDVATAGASSCNPAPGTVQPCYQAPPASAATPTSVSTPAPYSFLDPQTQVPQGTFANISTVLLERIEQGLSGSINASIYVAQVLFVRIACMSVILSFLGCFLDGEGIVRAFRVAYWRFLETFLWLAFIQWTWQGPGGIPGWFPTIIGGIAAIGSEIANQVAGTPIATFQNYTVDFTVMPGTILDLGAALFSAISNIAWTMFTGGGATHQGPASAIISIASSALNGTMLVNFAVYCMMMGAGIYVYAVCFWIAWRYFLTVMHIFLIACLSFFQGFAGSRRLSGFAGGFFSTAIVLGAEFALTTIIVGIFYGVLIWLIKSSSLWPPVANIIAASGSIPIAPLAWARTGINIGYLLLLDMIVTAWVMTMTSVPKKVGDYFSGRLSIAPSEVVKAAQSSPTIGGKLLGTAAATVQSLAQRGPIGTIHHTAGQLGSFALIGASSKKRGTAAGIVDGAMRGGVVGGMPGAVAGAVGSWVAGKFVPTKKDDRAAQNTEQPNNPPNNNASKPESEATTASRATHENAKTTENTSTNLPPPQQPSGTNVERQVTITDRFSSGNQNDAESVSANPSQKTISGTFEADNTKNGKTLHAGTPRHKNNSMHDEYLKGMAEWEQMRSGTPPTSAQKTLDDVERQTRIATSIARTVAYAHQYRTARGERQIQDEQSITIPQPNMNFGGKS